MANGRTVTVSAKITQEAFEALEAKRAGTSRSTFIADLIEPAVLTGDRVAAVVARAEEPPAAPPAEVVPIESARATGKATRKPKAAKKASSPATRKPDSKAEEELTPEERQARCSHPADRKRQLSYGTFCGACGYRIR